MEFVLWDSSDKVTNKTTTLHVQQNEGLVLDLAFYSLPLLLELFVNHQQLTIFPSTDNRRCTLKAIDSSWELFYFKYIPDYLYYTSRLAEGVIIFRRSSLLSHKYLPIRLRADYPAKQDFITVIKVFASSIAKGVGN